MAMTTPHIIQLHLEKLPEGLWLATSNDVQGLIAQGRTISEAIEIARDVARKLIELQVGGQDVIIYCTTIISFYISFQQSHMPLKLLSEDIYFLPMG